MQGGEDARAFSLVVCHVRDCDPDVVVLHPSLGFQPKHVAINDMVYATFLDHEGLVKENEVGVSLPGYLLPGTSVEVRALEGDGPPELETLTVEPKSWARGSTDSPLVLTQLLRGRIVHSGQRMCLDHGRTSMNLVIQKMGPLGLLVGEDRFGVVGLGTRVEVCMERELD